jgi:hypothetical protein
MSTNVIDIQALIDALDRNTAAHLGKAAATTAPAGEATKPAAGAAKAGTKAPAAAKGPKVTFDQVSAALMKIKDDFGFPEAKTIITSFGADKMSELKESDYTKILPVAEARYEELSTNAPSDPEDEENL